MFAAALRLLTLFQQHVVLSVHGVNNVFKSAVVESAAMFSRQAAVSVSAIPS
jgi:esterase/lipase superfamily enzyme